MRKKSISGARQGTMVTLRLGETAGFNSIICTADCNRAAFNGLKVFLSFIISFDLLRTTTNGWHARSFVLCLMCSIVGECVFLGVFSHLWNPVPSLFGLILSAAIIWKYAPYNHPNMNLSTEEIMACRRAARKRLVFLIICSIVFRFLSVGELSCGIDLGILQVAIMLILAYIIKAKSAV